MNQRINFFILLATLCVQAVLATPYNIAPQAKITASACIDEKHNAKNVADGTIRVPNQGDWAADSHVTFWGQIDYPWVKLEWNNAVSIDRVVLYDRPETDSHIAGGVLSFSDGTKINVWSIPNDGTPKEVTFEPKRVEWVRFEATDAVGKLLGLSEIEVFPSGDDYADYVSWVNPFVETARGRYFFFITGNQPFGMIGAAPLTRNINQFGGGYNYNSPEILGFPQIHCWMLSGLMMMPTTGTVNLTAGEQGWKSAFNHEGEIAQPGYHRLYLDRYGTWVEQTATDRVSFYRFTFTADDEAHILLDLGGYVGTSTMVNAHVMRSSDTSIEGYFDTTGRLWGGPDVVRIYFVAEFDTPFNSLDGWNDNETAHGIQEWQGPGIERCVARNSGMSYSDAPTAGVAANFGVKPGDRLCMKMAVSYVSIANARDNMAQECNHWNFDATRKASQAEWNEWLGRIDVKGGTMEQRTKFYTDMWHTLLGRHKIDDANGDYPDYTDGVREGAHTRNINFRSHRLPKGNNGKPIHHIYNSDALWLTQWNQNTLWGMAYPEVVDDFAASLLAIDANGGLIPRGPCAGGYSYIMTGCPGTSLITSAYQKGLTHKWNVEKGFKAMKRNHSKGGMLAFDMDKELKFYEANGYCPGSAGLTIQWTFEDWALGEMAYGMGKKADYRKFNRRATRWAGSFHKGLGLILPRNADGTWLHTNPLDGWGYVEANAWQATFGLSHDIPRLAEMMGGNDSLCSKLDYAFRNAAKDDFVYGYGGGYVSYANQPGCSNAHVFSHAGKPWLTQYWVRRVNEQAYGSTTPNRGYGGHDEDQGQMGAVSALMSIGLFSIDGGSLHTPCYDITSPVFDEITIKLDNAYYQGDTFKIITHNNSADNCYIQRATLNGSEHRSYQITHEAFARGGVLELWLGSTPCTEWGIE